MPANDRETEAALRRLLSLPEIESTADIAALGTAIRVLDAAGTSAEVVFALDRHLAMVSRATGDGTLPSARVLMAKAASTLADLYAVLTADVARVRLAASVEAQTQLDWVLDAPPDAGAGE